MRPKQDSPAASVLATTDGVVATASGALCIPRQKKLEWNR